MKKKATKKKQNSLDKILKDCPRPPSEVLKEVEREELSFEDSESTLGDLLEDLSALYPELDLDWDVGLANEFSIISNSFVIEKEVETYKPEWEVTEDRNYFLAELEEWYQENVLPLLPEEDPDE